MAVQLAVEGGTGTGAPPCTGAKHAGTRALPFIRCPTRWTPHITLAYSTAVQPTGPIIDALGRELPECKITVGSVSLVAQRGAERQWDWHPIAEVRFGTPAAS
jgi:hypothetical protein